MLKKYKRYYDIAFVVLAVISVIMAMADLMDMGMTAHPLFYTIDSSILLVFAIDYAVRLYLANDKREFFKTNIFDLIAIIPFSEIFTLFRTLRIVKLVYLARLARFARITKIFKLTRLIGVGGRLKGRVNDFLHMNGLIYIIYLNLASMVIGAVAIYLLEKGTTVNTFADALWWAFVTSTTVGYGDISPSTGGGRIVAVVLMLLGIGLVSMLTGTIASYFTIQNSRARRSEKREEIRKLVGTMTDEQLERVLEQMREIGKEDDE